MTLDAIMEKIHSPNILVDGYGYQSGKSSDWIKVKAKRWRERNAWRGEFFQTGR